MKRNTGRYRPIGDKWCAICRHWSNRPRSIQGCKPCMLKPTASVAWWRTTCIFNPSRFEKGIVMSEKLTESDLNSIRYFYREYNDVTRWSGWDDKKHLVEKQFPEVIAAMNNLTIAERTLAAVIKNMEIPDENI